MVYKYHIFLMFSSAVENWSCVHSLVIVNNTALNKGVQVCLLYPDVQSSEYMPKSAIAGSYDSSFVSLLSYLHTTFHMVVLI
jgi:hypothetical protein